MTVFEQGGLILRDTAGFLDAHNGTLTGIATVAVAAFTYSLWRVTSRQARLTRQLAESTDTAARAAQETAAITGKLAESTEMAAKAAQESAAAIPALERAYIFIEIEPHGLRDIRERLTRDPKVIVVREMTRDNTDQTASTLWFHLANHGKTPAVIKATTFTLQYRADTDGPALLVAKPLPSGLLAIASGMISSASLARSLEPTPNTSFKLLAQLGQPLTPEEVERLRSGLYVLLFVGRVIYEDVFGAEHETRICRRYDPETHTLVEYGGIKFNSRT
jgi:hypothetical protein